MTFTILKTGAALAGLMTCSLQAAAQEDYKHFHGLYGGVDVGFQNIFGGALVGGIDTLARATRFTASGLLGARYQFDNGIVVGIEGQLGTTDGDLSLNSVSQDLSIAYENNSQSAYGATLGYAFGSDKHWLAYVYAIETSRDFDVTITSLGGTFTQQDNQGILRYGAGIEKFLGRGFHLRAALGTQRADFGDRVTNIDVNGKLEGTLGLLLQF